MNWEASIIEALQNAGNRTLDYIIYALTFMGDQLFFIMITAVIYWCFSKKYAFRFLNVYLWTVAILDVLKSIFVRVRPYEKFENVKSVISDTHGWSFPSGHSNSIASIGTQLTLKAKTEKRYVRPVLIVSIVAALVVMFSRVYLGQHYPTDVIAGVASGILFTFVFNNIYGLLEKKSDYFWVVVLPLGAVITLILLLTGSAKSAEMLIKALGAYGAAALGYYLEQRFVQYDIKSGAAWKQVLKVLSGMAVALLILEGGKYLCLRTIPSLSTAEVIVGWYLRYFLTGLWAMLGAPFVFKKVGL